MTNTERAAALHLNRNDYDGKWYILGHFPEMGPYDTKAEAMEDLRGVQRFYREEAEESLQSVPSLQDLLI